MLKKGINFVVGIIGANRTGKTPTEREMILKWKKRNPYGSVVGFDPQRKLHDLLDFNINPEDKNWAEAIWIKCRNSLIVLDDFKGLTPNYMPTPGMRKMFVDRTFHNNDYIYSCHSPSNVLEIFTEYTTKYYIFHTKIREGKFKEKMLNAFQCIAAATAVNKYVSVHGIGKHPLDPEFSGQKFPYMVVDTQDETIKAYNMHKQLTF